MNIKICGISTLEAAQTAINAGATHIGFIFFGKSLRNISVSKAAEIAGHIKGKIKTVFVTVDPSDEFLDELFTHFKPDYIQLHGNETPERCGQIKQKYNIKTIKAIAIESEADLAKADEYRHYADYIMFDAKPPKNSKLPGGNAVSFDWKILQNFDPDYKWILSGGLNPENVLEAVKSTNADFVDVSSGVESSPGKKDNSLINNFVIKLF